MLELLRVFSLSFDALDDQLAYGLLRVWTYGRGPKNTIGT
jgi:hypothetical protein